MTPAEPPLPDGGAAAVFRSERRRLFGLAYRLLGSASDAEDVLQSAFEKWIAADTAAVAVPGAWLTTVVTNLCLRELGSPRRQRERYSGTWLPEPVGTSGGTLGPLETAEQRDSVSFALLLVMERLSAPERAVFVLREAFGYPYAEIARVLRRPEASCRQLHRRARQRLGTDTRRFQPVVVGAGLAGLAAGASAARAGARVIILDGRSPGGRARTSIRDGFRFNQCPHALYRGGCGRRVLRRLGIRVTGHAPRLRGSRIFAAGCPERFAAVQVARIVARVAPASAAGQAGRSTGEWISSLRLPGEAAAYLAAFIRLTSYVADFGRMPASLAISQLRTALRGADYLDGGWQQLTSALLSCACAAGAQLRPRTRADLVDRARGAWDVYTGGEVIRAAAVVVAVGRPAAAQRLLPAGPHWAQTCPEVTAACLDLGVRSPGAPFILGIDAPLYLSPHCPPGDLAPTGCGLVHVMRYGAGVPAADRAQLRGLAAAAGIGPGEVVAERFLPRMVVSSWLPSPESGLGGRPPVTVPGPAGLFLAGDWVGPQGWLGDGSLASGERAGLLAARAAGSSM